MTIKMSDVFELPMIDHGRNNLATDHRDETEAAIIAINAYDANQEEIAELKQLAETKNARTLERIGRIEQQEREIAELKSLAAYAEQRANIAEKTSEALKAKLQSVKGDAVKEAAFKLADDLLISPHAQREMMEYAMELEGKS